MRKTAHVERRFDNEHRILDKLAEMLPVGEPVTGMSYPDVAAKIGEPAHAVLLAKRTMEDAGILKTRLEYPKGQSGRVSVWELTMPLARAHEEMKREHELQLHRPSNKARRRMARIDPQSGEMLGVRLPRLEEARQLIDNVRSYVQRMEWARQNFADMRASGIQVDMSAVMVERDPKMDTIALVLPFVDELERRVERAEEQADRWRQELIALAPKNGKSAAKV